MSGKSIAYWEHKIKISRSRMLTWGLLTYDWNLTVYWLCVTTPWIGVGPSLAEIEMWWK